MNVVEMVPSGVGHETMDVEFARDADGRCYLQRMTWTEEYERREISPEFFEIAVRELAVGEEFMTQEERSHWITDVTDRVRENHDGFEGEFEGEVREAVAFLGGWSAAPNRITLPELVEIVDGELWAEENDWKWGWLQ